MQFARWCLTSVIFLVGLPLLHLGNSEAAELWVGAATTSITPDEPVALAGQRHTRIAREVESPVLAVALALESRNGEDSVEQSILISCDLIAIRGGVIEGVRERLAERLPEFDAQKLVLSATHTHTGPVLREGRYEIPDDAMQPSEYVEFLVDRLVEVAAEAWQSRAPGKVSWGLGHAVVAHNRRAIFADGTAIMYADTSRADFQGIEGYEDQGTEVLIFWDRDDRLLATAINVAVPSQEVEMRSAINADFWHEVREMLRERHGEDLHVLGWTGASGDNSPRPMFRRAAEDRMRNLRGLTRLEEVARRIVNAWEEVYEAVRQDIHEEVVHAHYVEQVELPRRREAGEDAETERPPFEMELHVIRLGDVAIATNVFELFTDYGVRIKGRSPALQTFIIQLAGPGSYLPTERAVRGGGYGAEHFQVGPEGGQVLVDKTLEAIEALWRE